MPKRHYILIILTTLFTWSIVGCSAPLPTATPVPPAADTATAPPTQTPRATATPLPTETPLPAPTATTPPLPSPTPVAGYYRHPELGFWFNYPPEWFLETTGSNLPAVIISDNDDPVQLLAGGRALEEGTELAEFARSVKDELGLAETVELVADAPAALADGTPAWEITLAWEGEEGQFMARGYTAVSGANGYAILLFGRPEVIEARANTVQAIAGSLKLEQPELFGVSRENGLFLLVREPATLDPALSDEGLDGVIGHVFSGLVRFNSDLQIEPDLAERWEISEDGTTYTFHLRPDATFHDGRPVTAADVQAAWNRATDPALGSTTAPLFLSDIAGAAERMAGSTNRISGVEANDDHTLLVTLAGPRPYFLAKLTQPVTFVTHPQNVTEGNEWWRNPVGTGPFRLSRWQPGLVLQLESNPDYYLTPPALQTAVFMVGSSSFAAYESGLVDLATVSPRNLARARDPGEPLSADLVSGSLLCTRRILFDVTQAPFDNADVRRAFSLAVDRQQLAELVLNDAATPAVGILPPGMPGFVERPAAPEFDVAAAQDLLGDPAALPPLILATGGSGTADPLVVALADMWQTNLGVTIETRLIDPAAYKTELPNRPGHLFTANWCADYPDPENMLDLLYYSDSPANYSGYANEEVDALLEAARTESDPAIRLDLYQQAESLLLADTASIQTVHPQAHVLVRPTISGYQHTPIPIPWLAQVTITREAQQ